MENKILASETNVPIATAIATASPTVVTAAATASAPDTDSNPPPSTVPNPAPSGTPCPGQCAVPPTTNVVTIPVPIVHNEETYVYVAVKGSLHDSSCAVFGLNEAEIQAISKRFNNAVKTVVNGYMVTAPAIRMINTLAELSYKVVCSSGEGEICWTLQREV